MSTPTPLSQARASFSWSFFCIACALISGWILSILSWQEVCTTSCSASKDYRLFGLPFPYIGMAFFSVALPLHFFSSVYPRANAWIAWMIASALGAEVWFLFVQKYEIGHWCPICLSIAASIATAALFMLTGYIACIRQAVQQRNLGKIMQNIKTGFTSLSFVLLGLFLSFLGMTKINDAEAAVNEMKNRLAFGNKNSVVEIYFVSDWFCPSCKKIEPEMEAIYESVKSKVTFYFIDYAIHQKSLNYTPYNLAFLVNNKSDYLQARRVLHELAKKNESPTDEDIMEAMKKKNIHFDELSFLQVKAGMGFFDSIVATYNIHSTPTMVIVNKENHKVVKLEGKSDITEANVSKAIAQVQTKK